MRTGHALLVLALVSCRDEPTVIDGHPLTEPTRLCRGETLKSCRAATDVEALLVREDLEILAARETSTGVQGAYVLTLRGGGNVFRAKWRPDASATRRNDPRLELAAYEVQKLFLEPHEYVVPPSARHCFPVATYRAKVGPARAGRCVPGILSYWLEDVTTIADAQRAGWFDGLDDHALDLTKFMRDPTYRDSIARVNVLTYVIGHRDSHARNFVLARSGSPVVYSIDNSLSFTMAPNPRIRPEHDWSKIRVPALPRAVIDRLRDAVKRASALEILTPTERAGVVTRMNELIASAESGAVPLY